jgi:hypothetical protein
MLAALLHGGWDTLISFHPVLALALHRISVGCDLGDAVEAQAQGHLHSGSMSEIGMLRQLT